MRSHSEEQDLEIYWHSSNIGSYKIRGNKFLKILKENSHQPEFNFWPKYQWNKREEILFSDKWGLSVECVPQVIENPENHGLNK